MPMTPELLRELIRALRLLALESARSVTKGAVSSAVLTAIELWAAAHAAELTRGWDEQEAEEIERWLEMRAREELSRAELQERLEEALPELGRARAAMLARTLPAQANILGKLEVWREQGFEFFEVQDSPGCLPDGHAKDDIAPDPSGRLGVVELGNNANGQVWTYAQVLAHVLGHPNCERNIRALTRFEVERLLEVERRRAA